MVLVVCVDFVVLWVVWLVLIVVLVVCVVLRGDLLLVVLVFIGVST